MDVVLTKRQRKRRCAKDRKQSKRFTYLSAEINALRQQMELLKEKISLASKSATPGLGRKKKCSMQRDIEKISTQLKDSESCLESMRVPTNPVTKAPVNLHPPSRS